MRVLTGEEMISVAGGHDPNNPKKEIKLPEVLVTAQRERNAYDALMYQYLLERIHYIPPSDNESDHQEPCFINNADPKLEQEPSGVDIRDMRQSALLVQDYVKGKNQSIEWGALLIADRQGNVRIGDISSGDEDSVQMAGNLVAGERIVATVHSHPSTSGADHSLPSTNRSNGPNSDNDERNTLNLIASGRMDQNGLIYIIDNASGQMYEYDPKNISKQNRNNITDDLRQYGYECNG